MGVPRGTPAPIVERLNQEINAGLADPGIKARLAEVGGSPLVYTSGELGDMITHDAEKWRQVIKRAGIQPE
jgi:tripartite-type tricarboxylate transporter receptor subunit TctC